MESEKQKKVNNRGGTVCCVPNCPNNTRINRNVSWHTFPVDSKIKKLWLKEINRAGKRPYSSWVPTKNHRICGMHFNVSGKKQNTDVVPKHFNTGLGLATSSDVLSVNAEAEIIKPNLINDSTGPLTVLDSISTSIAENFELERESGCDLNCDTEDKIIRELRETINQQSESIKKLNKNLEMLQNENTTLKEEIRCQTENINRISAELENIKIEKNNLENVLMTEVDSQKKTNALLILENNNLKEEKRCLQAEKFQKFDAEAMIQDEKMLHYYTGFNGKVRFEIFENFITPGYLAHCKGQRQEYESKVGRPHSLDKREQLVMVLMKFRLGLEETDLSYRFKISQSTVSSIWTTWVNLLQSQLTKMPIWPSKELVQKYMPEAFKAVYPNTRIILDCTEIFIERPSECNVQSETYSQYKSHNTAKGLIGITPNGFVSFVSDLYPGRVSDRNIIQNSGIINQLEEGDDVMADRGCLIEDLLNEKFVTLNMPPFLRGRSQLDASEVQETKEIAALRVHVERVINLAKTFRIIKFVFPNTMHSKLNAIWKVSCYLVNVLGEPLLDRK